MWERGRLSPPRKFAQAVKTIAPHEVCFILRRRSGQSQAIVAELIGCSSTWVRLMEKGKAPVGELLHHWGHHLQNGKVRKDEPC